MAVFVVFAALLAGCGPAESTLAVHNRTNAPVTFVNGRGEMQYVAACSSGSFRWDGAWTSKAHLDAIPGALEVRIDAAPPADSGGAFVAVVTSESILSGLSGDATGSLPPCGGAPPTSLALIVYNTTNSAVSFNSRGATHYLKACGSWRYEWIDGGWVNRFTGEVAIPDAFEVRIDVAPPPAARVDTLFVVITSRGASVVEADPVPRPSCRPAGSGG